MPKLVTLEDYTEAIDALEIKLSQFQNLHKETLGVIDDERQRNQETLSFQIQESRIISEIDLLKMHRLNLFRTNEKVPRRPRLGFYEDPLASLVSELLDEALEDPKFQVTQPYPHSDSDDDSDFVLEKKRDCRIL